jgi:hypothetical protein
MYAAFAKAAAFILRRMRLRWSHALVFGVLAFLVGVTGMILNRVIGMHIPFPIALLIGLAALLAVGGWYLGPRATTAEGAIIQFKGGVLLSLTVYGFIAALGIVAAFLVPLVNHVS